MEVEWLILADAAQVLGGKLFLLGGGWDVLTVNSAFPLQQRCAVAVALRVPWNETNQRHQVEIEIEDEDGQHELFSVGKVIVLKTGGPGHYLLLGCAETFPPLIVDTRPVGGAVRRVDRLDIGDGAAIDW